ncbi:LuxR C-terminal-related transcriptional regulator [Dapis sp. BLCC M172]|uniref:LuxR C-terminal-related transcriptional regulator n=1 Tax=Dapis sp. BLCC M172 TaxID=2975281 RepID=UPI003CE6E41F
MSNKFYLSKNTAKSDLSRTLYKYVNELTGKKIGHSLAVSKYLKEAGYRRTINLLSIWDIDRILEYLALKKGKNLTNKETCWLHLLLQELDTEEISNELYLSQKTVKSDLSKTLYKYVKELTGKKINHPLEVSKHLKEAGYIEPLKGSI